MRGGGHWEGSGFPVSSSSPPSRVKGLLTPTVHQEKQLGGVHTEPEGSPPPPLTFKGPVQLDPILGNQVAVVLAQPEALVAGQVSGGLVPSSCRGSLALGGRQNQGVGATAVAALREVGRQGGEQAARSTGGGAGGTGGQRMVRMKLEPLSTCC